MMNENTKFHSGIWISLILGTAIFTIICIENKDNYNKYSHDVLDGEGTIS